jgi:NAD(P)H dehydrogenase (quinone)
MFAVLGATGKVGRATIGRLRANGAAVRAVVRDASKAQDLAALGCTVAEADLRDGAALTAALEGASAVQVICPVMTAAADAPAEMRDVIGRIAAALASVRPQAVVAISDYGAERDSGTGITLMFHELEARLRAVPATLTFVRSAEHMQNWARLARAAAATGILPSLHHPLTKRFPTVSAPDVGLVAADLMMSPPSGSPRVVYVEGPRRYTPLDVAETLGTIVGRRITARELPQADWIPALVRGGLSQSYAQLVSDLYVAHNAGAIDVEPGAEDVRRGTTELHEVVSSLMRDN